MRREISLPDVLMWGFLFICIFSSVQWSSMPSLTQGELIRFDNFHILGQVNIFSFFAAIFFVFIFFEKFGPHNQRTGLGRWNFLKTIFWLFFVPVNVLIYITVYLKDIALEDLGVRPIVTFFVLLVVVYFVQDLFFEKKDLKQVMKILNALQILFFARCLYSIMKYFIGFGYYLRVLGRIRVGQENDFADYYILLYILSLSRLLFEKNDDRRIKLLNFASLISCVYLFVFSFRRYLWIEFLLATGIILFFHVRRNTIKVNKIIAVACLLFFAMSSLLLLAGPKRLSQNLFIGRLMTALSLVDSRFESEYGTDTRHPDEIKEAWMNLKTHWLLGVTPYGGERLTRYKTAEHTDVYFHNAYMYIWLSYGLLGFIAFVTLYAKSFTLGYHMFFKRSHFLGLVLGTFIVCQLTKNIIWDTIILKTNVTVIYIFFISLVIRAKVLLEEEENTIPAEP